MCLTETGRWQRTGTHCRSLNRLEISVLAQIKCLLWHNKSLTSTYFWADTVHFIFFYYYYYLTILRNSVCICDPLAEMEALPSAAHSVPCLGYDVEKAHRVALRTSTKDAVSAQSNGWGITSSSQKAVSFTCRSTHEQRNHSIHSNK